MIKVTPFSGYVAIGQTFPSQHQNNYSAIVHVQAEELLKLIEDLGESGREMVTKLFAESDVKRDAAFKLAQTLKIRVP